MRRAAATALLVALAAFGAAPTVAAAATPTVTEFSRGITPGAEPQGIAMGPDGDMWFTELGADKIGRITPAGVVTEFPLPAGSVPFDIAAGHDGTMWFSEFRAGKIGRIAMDGTLLPEIPLSAGAGPTGIATDANGNIWVAEPGISKLARYSAGGARTLFEDGAGLTANAGPWGVAPGPDFAMWFTEIGADEIGRHGVMDVGSSERGGPRGEGIAAGPDGEIWSVVPSLGGYAHLGTSSSGTGTTLLPTASSFPVDIAPGPDGLMWITENDGDKLARVGPNSLAEELSAGISPGAAPYGIAAGPDGAMWFTESGGDRIGRITTGEDQPAFTSSAPIRPPSGSGGSSPYPSAIQVAGLQGTVKRVRVRLNGLFAQQPNTLNALLVDPAGHAVLLLGGVGANADASGAVLTFADDGLTPGQLVTGVYVPRDDGFLTTLPAPAPAGPYSTSLSAFNGADPNGQWKLYLARTFGASDASDVLSGGWSLDVQTSPPQTIAVPGPTQTVTVAAPAPAPAPADRRAAKVTLAGVPRTTTLAKLLKGISIALAPDEPASFDVLLTGTTRKATLAAVRVLLFEKTLATAAGRRSVKLKPARSAIGRPRKAFKLALRVVATDRGGNRTVVSRTIAVRPAASRRRGR